MGLALVLAAINLLAPLEASLEAGEESQPKLSEDAGQLLAETDAFASVAYGSEMDAAPEPEAEATDEASAETLPEASFGLAERLGFKVSARSGGWSHSRDLDDREWIPVAGLRARIAPRLGAFDAFAEGYVQADGTGKVRPDLVDGWMRYTSGDFELRAGRQVVVWGRADRLNPTDNISGRDYTLLVASDDDQRQGPAMVQVRWGRGNYTLDGYWLPEFRPIIFPLERERPGIAILPDQRVSASDQFAFKLDSSGGSFDWSVSWFRGIDRNRDFTLRPPLPGTFAAIQQTYPNISVIGADAAGIAGRVGWRLEAAFTDVRGPDSPYVKNDNLWIVGGGDVSFGGGWNVNLQYSLRVIFDYEDPRRITNLAVRAVASLSAAVNNQLDKVQNGVTARLARRFARDTAEAEIAVIHYVESGDSAIRPRITFAIRDGLRLAVGADIFGGPELSAFGRVRSLSAGWLQLTAGF
jgi:hypothetical protein